MISVIIPVLNEEDTIRGTVDELAAWFETSMPGRAFEIIVVNDGSTDRTALVLKELADERAYLQVAHHPYNIGRGQAVRTGLLHAKGDYVVSMDADLSYEPNHIRILIEPLERGEADITLASAYHPEGKVENVPFRRALISRIGNWVLSLGTYGEFHTVTCIVRGFRRDAIANIDLVNTDKDLHLEIIQKAQLFGLRVREVPATLAWRDRKRQSRSVKKKRPIRFLPGRGSVIGSHLAYGFAMRPSLFVVIPLITLALAIAAGSATLLYQFGRHLFGSSHASWVSGVYQALRTTLIEGNLTLIIVFFAAVILMQFFAFVMIASQNKRTYEEMIVLLGRTNDRIRELQASDDKKTSVKKAVRQAF